MKCKFILVSIMSLIMYSNTYSEISCGILIGYPYGLTMGINNKYSIDLGLNRNGLLILPDYWLIYKPVLKYHWYFGVGPTIELKFLDDYNKDIFGGIGLRLPFGMQSIYWNHLELFLTTAPGIWIFPTFMPQLYASGGFRYIF